MEPGAGARLRIFGVTQVRSLLPLNSVIRVGPRCCQIDRRLILDLTRSQGGNSVLLHVNSFLPYLYIAAPRGFTNEDCREFTNALNVRPHLLCASLCTPDRLTSLTTYYLTRTLSALPPVGRFSTPRSSSNGPFGDTKATTTLPSSRSPFRTPSLSRRSEDCWTGESSALVT